MIVNNFNKTVTVIANDFQARKQLYQFLLDTRVLLSSRGRNRTSPNKSYLCVMPCQNICHTVELSHDFYFRNLFNTSSVQFREFTPSLLDMPITKLL